MVNITQAQEVTDHMLVLGTILMLASLTDTLCAIVKQPTGTER